MTGRICARNDKGFTLRNRPSGTLKKTYKEGRVFGSIWLIVRIPAEITGFLVQANFLGMPGSEF